MREIRFVFIAKRFELTSSIAVLIFSDWLAHGKQPKDIYKNNLVKE